MRKFYFLLALTVCYIANAQTVSTFLNDPAVDVDDSMIFDTSGNLYGSNFGGDTVYKITPAGTATIFISGLANPNGLAFDSTGNLFVIEYSAGSIHKYNNSGTLLNTYAVGAFPSGLKKDFSSDAMIFTLTGNNSVNKLETDGTIIELFHGAPLNAPVGLAFDDSGTLYIGNYVGREIYQLNGAAVNLVATVPDGGVPPNAYLGFITYGNGKLWGTVMGAGNIYSINPNAVDDVTLFAGTSVTGNTDGPVVTATFAFPNGIIYNSVENALYVSEFSGIGNIRKISDIPLHVDQFVQPEISMSISPNPSSEFITLTSNSSFLNATQVNITIYDVTGKQISSLEQENNTKLEIKIDISEFQAGHYFLKFVSSNGYEIYKRFIRQ